MTVAEGHVENAKELFNDTENYVYCMRFFSLPTKNKKNETPSKNVNDFLPQKYFTCFKKQD